MRTEEVRFVHWCHPFLAVYLLICTSVPAHAASVKLEVDQAKSYIVVVTRKGGLLGFAGHEHGILATEWSVDVCFDKENPRASRAKISIPTLSLRIDTEEARRKAGLKAEGPSPKDAAKIQDKMLAPQNLDAQGHPEIQFTTNSVERKDDTIVLTGPMTIRGTTRTISSPVKLESQAGAYVFSGEFKVKQTEYGIKPESIGGVVSVKDPVEIRFQFHARSTTTECAP
ncbi:MAG: YceI family protein [Acidobacteria bacterium]|nr:YceI family protein [Acidobacteriota bacterium]